jgi:hypothetical protein
MKGRVKKLITILMVFTMFILVSFVAYAEENLKVKEVYETRYDAVYLDVERTVTLSGDVMPDESINWSEVVNGNTYAGTLYLENFYVYNNVTVALYVGQLRRVH